MNPPEYYRLLLQLFRHYRENPVIECRGRSRRLFKKSNRALYAIHSAVALLFVLGGVSYLVGLYQLSGRSVDFEEAVMQFGTLWYVALAALLPNVALLTLAVFQFPRRSPEMLEQILLTTGDKREMVFGGLCWPFFVYLRLISVPFIIANGAVLLTIAILQLRHFYLLMSCAALLPLFSYIAIAYFVAVRGWLLFPASYALQFLYVNFNCGVGTICMAIFGLVAPPVALLLSAVVLLIMPYLLSRHALRLYFSPLQPIPFRQLLYLETVQVFETGEFKRWSLINLYNLMIGIFLPFVALLFWYAGYDELAVGGMAGSFIGNTYSAKFQLCFSPIMLWAMLALFLKMYGSAGRYDSWIRWGLVGGVLYSGLVSVQFLPLIPISLIGIFFMGIGLLGFLPFLIFALYFKALRDCRNNEPKHEVTDQIGIQTSLASADFRPKALQLLLWLICGFAGLLFALIHESPFMFDD